MNLEKLAQKTERMVVEARKAASKGDPDTFRSLLAALDAADTIDAKCTAVTAIHLALYAERR